MSHWLDSNFDLKFLTFQFSNIWESETTKYAYGHNLKIQQHNKIVTQIWITAASTNHFRAFSIVFLNIVECIIK